MSTFSNSNCNYSFDQPTVIQGIPGPSGADGLTPYIRFGFWWIGNRNTGIPARGQPGQPGQPGADGITPQIGSNGNWWIGDVDTGTHAVGIGTPGQPGLNGATPQIGPNGNWWINNIDTGVSSQGLPGPASNVPGSPGADGLTPHIGPAGFWFIGTVNTGIKAQGDPGSPGIPGPTGVGILQIQNQFITTTSITQPSANLPEWQPTISNLTINHINKYLWRKERVLFTNQTSTEHIMLIAIYGTGADGLPFVILDTYDSVTEFKSDHPTGNVGDAYLVGGHLFIWSAKDNEWSDEGVFGSGDNIDLDSYVHIDDLSDEIRNRVSLEYDKTTGILSLEVA